MASVASDARLDPIPRWPVCTATLDSDGTGQLTINGVAQDITAESIAAARETVSDRVTNHAREILRRPVRLTVTDPDGEWELAAHPDGTITSIDPPRPSRAKRVTNHARVARAPKPMPASAAPGPALPTTTAARAARHLVPRRILPMALLGASAAIAVLLALTALTAQHPHPAVRVISAPRPTAQRHSAATPRATPIKTLPTAVKSSAIPTPARARATPAHPKAKPTRRVRAGAAAHRVGSPRHFSQPAPPPSPAPVYSAPATPTPATPAAPAPAAPVVSAPVVTARPQAPVHPSTPHPACNFAPC